MSASWTEAMAAWMLMIEQRLTRIEIVLNLPIGPDTGLDPERPDDGAGT